MNLTTVLVITQFSWAPGLNYINTSPKIERTTPNECLRWIEQRALPSSGIKMINGKPRAEAFKEYAIGTGSMFVVSRKASCVEF